VELVDFCCSLQNAEGGITENFNEKMAL